MDKMSDVAEGAAADLDVHEDPEDTEPVDLRDRELCPDGACIGVIGPDGRCKVCGAAAGPRSEASARADEPDQPDEGAAADLTDEDDSAPLDLSARRLCSDGSCIGVIGPDERCKVCGKPYSGEPEV